MEASRPRTGNVDVRPDRTVRQKGARFLRENRDALGIALLLAAIVLISVAILIDTYNKAVLAFAVALLIAILPLIFLHPYRTNTAKQQNTLDLLQSFFASFVSTHDQSASFMVLLREIQAQLGVAEGAIFIVQDADETLVPLASTPGSDVTNLAQCTSNGLQDDDRESRIVRCEGADCFGEFKLLSVPLHDNAGKCRGVLALKVDDWLPEQESAFLENWGAALAGVLGSARKSQANERQALYEERGVIARELHDSLAQSLSYLKIQVARLQALLMPETPSMQPNRADIDSVVQELRANLNLAYRQLREIITTFRLTTDGRSFGEALEDSLAEFEKKSSIVFRLDNRVAPGDLTIDQEMHSLHIIREALSNTVRHSRAMCAEISLRIDANGELNLTVDDDGCGIGKVRQRDRHHGLVIMQQRAHRLGGDFHAIPSQLGGTCVKVSFIAGERAKRTVPEKSSDD